MMNTASQQTLRCDGIRPQCGACKYREERCEYTQAESKRKRVIPNQYVAALEARVASLEERLKGQEVSGSLARSFVTPTQPPVATSKSDNIEEPFARRASASADESDSVDELTNVLGSFTIGDAGQLRFFGAASNFSLNRNYSFNDSSAIDARRRGVETASMLCGPLDVSDELRDHLLGLYWKWQNSWQYLVPMSTFLHDLHVGKTGRFCTPLLFMCMLAYASRYSDRLEVRTDPGDPNTAGKAFHIQAKTMLQSEYEAPTTSTVQATALIGLYAISTDNESLGWLYVGMASRMAFGLGLHSDCSEYVRLGILSPEDADARNVTWWGIYVLDRLFGLGLGRPVAIQEYNITALKPSTSDLDQNTDLLTSHVSTNAIKTCDLLERTSEVLDQLYARRPGWSYIEREDRVMQTHLSLTDFHDNLPQILKISASSLNAAQPQVYQLHVVAAESSEEDLHTQNCRIAAEKIAHIFRTYASKYTLVTSDPNLSRTWRLHGGCDSPGQYTRWQPYQKCSPLLEDPDTQPLSYEYHVELE
ncbi:hypothetical protein G7Y89_g15729 [Cudoniella acicularis]|uniref:Xylanolytic transcriptional activator regulatory domain-containing protein n=1 Tax=Cudoniella acicularis TaxID=354080 RepID=A0A8H4QGI8_9HELO|nr:hypothetical protein G7Y89_g15729 [Cudoniella acicularis]